MRYFTLLFLVVSFSGYSQTISKQVIGPAGATYENDINKLSYTTGEVLVGAMTAQDGSIQLGNGYYPSMDLETLNTETPELQLQVKVFPNPVSEALFITHPTEQFFEVRITDISGKQILQTAHQKQQPLSVQTLTTGTYFISVTTKDSKQPNTYKIIKK
ncbi:MAG: T9SS type A sorting domain-containing protein [Lacinutrix sp.]|uniref:T9SS type A sorting domain-containing protein n=1 Tax=Lacinutrix sp. TaxID=1937692 RepID=UPI0030B73749